MTEEVNAMSGPDKIRRIALEEGTQKVARVVESEVILDYYRNLI